MIRTFLFGNVRLRYFDSGYIYIGHKYPLRFGLYINNVFGELPQKLMECIVNSTNDPMKETIEAAMGKRCAIGDEDDGKQILVFMVNTALEDNGIMVGAIRRENRTVYLAGIGNIHAYGNSSV